MLFATRSWNLTFPLGLLGNPSLFFCDGPWISPVQSIGLPSFSWEYSLDKRCQAAALFMLHHHCAKLLDKLKQMIATVKWNDLHPGGGGWGTPSFDLNSKCYCTGYCFQALESLKKWSQGAMSGLVFELPTIFFQNFTMLVWNISFTVHVLFYLQKEMNQAIK